MTVSDYMNETVIYGGMETTRGEMILDLQRSAKSMTDDPIRQQQMVNMYLAGFERRNA